MNHRYAFLSPSCTVEPCSLETWFEWTDSPQYDPLLAQERLDDHLLALTFTGHWVGLPGERPRFFTVTVTHPRHAEQEWSFETFAEAHEGLRRLLEECYRRAEAELSETL